jgi:hypothetical protein
MTFMWPCIVIWLSCDRASWYDVHVTVHRDMTFMWPCIVVWRSCDRASWYDVHVTVHRDKFVIIKQTRRTNFSNSFSEWNATCFGPFLCPSSGVFHCTHSNGICHTGLLTAYSQAVSKPVRHIPLLCLQWITPDDVQRKCPKYVAFHSENEFEKSSWFEL